MCVDFGTAITFDVVSAEGEYVGGAHDRDRVSLEALTSAARGCRRSSSRRSSVIAKNNDRRDPVGSRLRLRRRRRRDPAPLHDELGDARGGRDRRSGALVVPFTEEIDEVDDLLTLTGLRLLYERNAASPYRRRARSLGDRWYAGRVRVPNRVVLAPLAGIGNWFVRLQAKRYGAGMAVSEMVSSHAIHYRNETHAAASCCGSTRASASGPRPGGPSRSSCSAGPSGHALGRRDGRGAPAPTLIDLNMGCPVPKVCKTGAGAALLADPDRAVAVARAARARAAGCR